MEYGWDGLWVGLGLVLAAKILHQTATDVVADILSYLEKRDERGSTQDGDEMS